MCIATSIRRHHGVAFEVSSKSSVLTMNEYLIVFQIVHLNHIFNTAILESDYIGLPLLCRSPFLFPVFSDKFLVQLPVRSLT